MMDQPALDNSPVLSVSDLSQALKRTVEGAFENVRVRGEISGFKRAASGHLYFTLKDNDAVLDAICWRGTAARLGISPEDGIEVIARGRLTTYPGRSKYQIVIDSLEIAGEGALLKLLEQRRQKLLEEGLFDETRKRSLPYLPEVIGIVTSETGAVLRDIYHRISERCPRHLIVWPVLVQGDKAADQISAAIRGFNAIEAGGKIPRPDVIIVARGGGSLEDLWAFNEESVVRAAAESTIPLISAIGHETDVTLIDFASDLRAPTPTAAAEFAVPVRFDVLQGMEGAQSRMTRALGRLLRSGRQQLDGLRRGLPDAQRVVSVAAQQLDDRAERLRLALRRSVDTHRQMLRAEVSGLRPPRDKIRRASDRLSRETRLLDRAFAQRITLASRQAAEMSRLLESVSPERVVDRGYAVLRDAKGKIVSDVAALHPGEDAVIGLRDGSAGARIMATSGDAHDFAPRKTKRKKTAKNLNQGSLF